MKLDQLWQVLLALIGALAGAYAGYWFGSQPEAVSFLEYKIYHEQNLTRMLGRTDDLRITYKGIEQAGLSRFEATVANTSNRNLERVRLYLEIRDPSKVPIISDFAVPEGCPRDLVKVLSKENGVYCYEIEYMNRASEIWNGFSFTLYFADPQAPEIAIKVAGKGIALRKYEFEHYSTTYIWLEVLLEEWWLVVLLICTVVFAFRYFGIATQVQEENAKRHLYSLLSEALPDKERARRSEESAKIMLEPAPAKSVMKLFFRRKNN